MSKRSTLTKSTVRCAIYTRKSSEEGLQQDFNSLDAQRESAEAYVRSQAHEGWTCLEDRYDDGGFSGGNTERPALKRLMADIDSGRIDCVVVYKVDRLSRSLLDFARLMEVFERHSVSFVSVTQAFHTGNSMGRLMLNVLLSFAQFEREIISERTRDKIAATRRKGKYSGGRPVLGYDVLQAPGGSRLVVNEDEAERVRQIFDLYLDRHSLVATAAELNRRGWRTKQWTTHKGTTMGGRPFDKMSLYALLSNVVVIGKVRHKTAVYDGEHPAIVGAGVFEHVQALLKQNGRSGGTAVRNKYGALLKGILRCSSCNCGMFHSYSSKKGSGIKYRYYQCLKASKRGWHCCPGPSVPAEAIEQFIVDRIRAIGSDSTVLSETIRQVQLESRAEIRRLEGEAAALERELKKHNAEVRRVIEQSNRHAPERLADLQDRIRSSEQRLTEVRHRLLVLGRELIDESQVAQALEMFDPAWDNLAPREKARIVQLLVERVDYDGAQGTVTITFHETGISALARQLSQIRQEVAA